MKTYNSAARIQPGAARHEVLQELGPFAPGLGPTETMLAPFSVVVDYRHYRLMYATVELKETEIRYM